ncbi:MAG: dienelactone hydrolase family protein [Acidimicrobiia bacterium]|jgi:dienelactone hydrolase
MALAGALLVASVGVAGTAPLSAATAAVPAGAAITTTKVAPASSAAGPAYAEPGKYAAGVTTLDLPDRKVEVWYPAKKKAATGAVPASFDLLEKVPPGIKDLLPAGTDVTYTTDAYRDIKAAKTKGGFPLVLMAHGTAGYREELAYLGEHLASWGFVVASPDITERGLMALLGNPPATPRDDIQVMRDTAALVRTASSTKGGPLAGRVKKDAVAVTGQSAGGGTAIRYGSEPGVVASIPISASGYNAQTGAYGTFPNVPIMFVTGTADQIVPAANVQGGFEKAGFPARYVGIDGAGHASVAGVCPIGGAGGLAGVADRAGLPVPDSLKQLAADGCATSSADPDPSWGVVRHAVTAQLRAAFGIDKKPIGLDQATMDGFAPVVVKYQEHLP